MAGAGVAAATGVSTHDQTVFDDLLAAEGWHPAHRSLLQLLANATSAGSGLDPAAVVAAALESSWAGGSALGKGKGPHGGGTGGGGGSGADPAGPLDISLLGLLLASLVIGVNGLISLWLRLGLHGKLAVATVRQVAQLGRGGRRALAAANSGKGPLPPGSCHQSGSPPPLAFLP